MDSKRALNNNKSVPFIVFINQLGVGKGIEYYANTVSRKHTEYLALQFPF